MCEKCKDKGFTEENHGLLMIFCDCEVGKELLAKQRETYGYPEEAQEGGIVDDPELVIVSRTGQLDTDTGSGDTGKPEKPKKRKAKRKAGKRAG